MTPILSAIGNVHQFQEIASGHALRRPARTGSPVPDFATRSMASASRWSRCRSGRPHLPRLYAVVLTSAGYDIDAVSKQDP
jgi:hypothetical protein